MAKHNTTTASINNADDSLLPPNINNGPGIYSEPLDVPIISTDTDGKFSSSINQDIVDRYGYDYTYPYPAFEDLHNKHGQTLDDYLLSEIHRLLREGIPVVSAILHHKSPAIQTRALIALDASGLCQTGKLVLVPDCGPNLPTIDVHGRPLDPREIGKVLDCKIGLVGDKVEFYHENQESQRSQYNALSINDREQKYLSTGLSQYRTIRSKKVYFKPVPQITFTRQEISLILQQWGYGIVDPRYSGVIEARKSGDASKRRDKWLVIQLPDDNG